LFEDPRRHLDGQQGDIAMGGYAFGDTSLAARCLALLADVFEPPSRAFLERFAGPVSSGAEPLDLAVDLGCGPGHSTRLVATMVGARRTLGLDQSGSFVARPPPGRRPGSSSPSTT
jgi:hypothetical protein